MSTKNLLILFTRNPELGKVKSRLAKDIGEEKALKIYIELLLHTKKISENIPVSKWVFYSEEIPKNDIWTAANFQKKIQQGTDLGFRMKAAFQEGFANGFEKIIVIGSDIYDLQQQHIEQAFEKLNDYTSVLGPSEDGGYYLLGLKSMIPEVFENKNWGTETVLSATSKDLKNNGSLYYLEELNDIDVISDIKSDSWLNNLL
ncbi:TIGR04282 family arsenosugar biosynthesis glycosyltransferase [Flavicella sediminum]|uniref:TIGR04282 family arsenosugar biosynthesis glycosyltransferase n=1 Tax=Flavicella sediminum TaxID=2585141 RepID=UPI0011207888|nr:TIGR04282 family arsenosugar biosynthesis glycosyltransferase [Flavicella sediminum]